ncbi:MAG TPA: metal ABC transporter permease [Terriglobales bacterium]|nr:metal ABC transporter permease [Terriglobales bacterium]
MPNPDLANVWAIVLGCTAAAAAGLVGAFALMKRTILAGDVMSHITIPGLGLAVIWKINPLVGGGLTLVVGILLIWKLGSATELSTEAGIGVMFATAVALGALLMHSSEELVDALFGGFASVSPGTFAFGMAASLVVAAALWRLRHRLILSLFSTELATASGVNVQATNLWFLLLFGLAILSSLQFLGGLLVGALIIVPASTARQLTHSLGAFLTASALLAVAAMAAGFFLSAHYGLELGPTVIVAAAAMFALSLLPMRLR